MCWKYSTWWRPLIWVFKDFLSQTQPTGISSFTPDQVNNNSKFWKHLGSTFPAVNWGAKPLQLHQTYFAALSLIQKLHLAKKLSKNGLFCQQQGLKQSTDGYAGLPLPTRWSMQRSQYKGERSTSWVTNYFSVDAKIKIKSNRDNKEGRCKERIRDRDVWGTPGQQSLLPFLGVPYFDSHRHQHQARFVGTLVCHYFQICKGFASCCASWKVETKDVPKVAKLVLWQGTVALEA